MTDTQANQLSTLYNQLILHEGDKVLLWTNNSPTSAFVAQTITISGGFSSYRYLIIECYTNTDSNYQTDIYISTQYNLRSTSATEQFYITAGGNNYRSAAISKTNGTVVFTAGCNNVGTTNNGLVIPGKIYGI